MERGNGGALEAEVRLEVLGDLTHETLEGELVEEELGGLLVPTDLGEQVEVGNMRPAHSEQQRSSQHATTLTLIGATPDRSVHVHTLLSLIQHHSATQNLAHPTQGVTKSKLHMAAARAARPARVLMYSQSEHAS